MEAIRTRLWENFKDIQEGLHEEQTLSTSR